MCVCMCTVWAGVRCTSCLRDKRTYNWPSSVTNKQVHERKFTCNSYQLVNNRLRHSTWTKGYCWFCFISNEHECHFGECEASTLSVLVSVHTSTWTSLCMLIRSHHAIWSELIMKWQSPRIEPRARTAYMLWQLVVKLTCKIQCQLLNIVVNNLCCKWLISTSPTLECEIYNDIQ